MYRTPRYKVQLVKDGSCVFEVQWVTCPEDAYNVIKAYLNGRDREEFMVLLLDVKNKIIGVNTVSIGSLSFATVTPREVFKPAILANAASIIVGHNHPSGDVSPSPSDIEVTGQLVKAGKLLGIPVLDHVIVGDTTYSFAQHDGEGKWFA